MHADRSRLAGAAGISLASHLALLVILGVLLASPARERLDFSIVPASLSYVRTPGPGGGGGGSNVPRPDPRPAPPAPEEQAAPAPPVPIQLSLHPASQPVDLPGTIAGLSAPIAIAGGAPGGTGGEPGLGAGPGRGEGIGPGRGGNTGGGEAVPGGNVTVPILIFEKKPTYTNDAVRARIEGTVELEAVVMADGSVARPRVVKSLDRGLDQRAIDAVLQWRFRPGRTRDTNEAVNVRITILLAFQLR